MHGLRLLSTALSPFEVQLGKARLLAHDPWPAAVVWLPRDFF
jgi:hypothetical protein